MDDESIAKRPNESLKEEIFSKFKLKMLTSGFTQSQCELATACFYYCTKGIQFSKTCKDLVATDPTSNYFLVKKFIATKMLEGLSEKTLKNYTREIVNLGKQVRLDKAGTDDIRSYLAQYRLRGASNRTADNARRYLSSFYAWLTAEDFVAKNPMLRIKKIKCEKTLKEPFSEVEMEKLRSACGGGSTVLAACQRIREFGYNPQTQVLVKAEDLDISCVHMTFAQLGLWGIPAIVKHGNTLTGEIFQTYVTPFICNLIKH